MESLRSLPIMEWVLSIGQNSNQKHVNKIVSLYAEARVIEYVNVIT